MYRPPRVGRGGKQLFGPVRCEHYFVGPACDRTVRRHLHAAHDFPPAGADLPAMGWKAHSPTRLPSRSRWIRLTEAAKPKRVAILASKEDHRLLDLLWRNRRGELDMSVSMIISNHPDLADAVRPFGVPFLHVSATKDNRAEAEERLLDLLRGN